MERVNLNLPITDEKQLDLIMNFINNHVIDSDLVEVTKSDFDIEIKEETPLIIKTYTKKPTLLKIKDLFSKQDIKISSEQCNIYNISTKDGLKKFNSALGDSSSTFFFKFVTTDVKDTYYLKDVTNEIRVNNIQKDFKGNLEKILNKKSIKENEFYDFVKSYTKTKKHINDIFNVKWHSVYGYQVSEKEMGRVYKFLKPKIDSSIGSYVFERDIYRKSYLEQFLKSFFDMSDERFEKIDNFMQFPYSHERTTVVKHVNTLDDAKNFIIAFTIASSNIHQRDRIAYYRCKHFWSALSSVLEIKPHLLEFENKEKYKEFLDDILDNLSLLLGTVDLSSSFISHCNTKTTLFEIGVGEEVTNLAVDIFVFMCSNSKYIKDKQKKEIITGLVVNGGSKNKFLECIKESKNFLEITSLDKLLFEISLD